VTNPALPLSIEIVVPGSPVSVNQTYAVASRGGRFYKRAVANTFQERIRSLAFAQAQRDGWLLRFKRIPIYVLIVARNIRHDIDGPVKLVLDALQGVLYENDSQIQELHVYRRDGPGDPELRITVGENA
jgi:Holliday junction resolvase RusA-like endonuclease